MKEPRSVPDFPERGNHTGDLIKLPSGQVYKWTEFKRWQSSAPASQRSKDRAMSDEELIARLRKADEYEPLGHDGWEAADRIEALTVESARRLALARSEGVARVEQFERAEALTEQLAAARQDAKEAEVYAEEVEKERDDYAHKLMQANNTYTGMHLEIERLSDKLATCEKYRDAYDEMGRIGTQAVRDLEAKLAKAVEGQKVNALEQILEERGAVFDAMVDAAEDAAGKDVSFNVVVGRALRAAIAEIKGKSHE